MPPKKTLPPCAGKGQRTLQFGCRLSAIPAERQRPERQNESYDIGAEEVVEDDDDEDGEEDGE